MIRALLHRIAHRLGLNAVRSEHRVIGEHEWLGLVCVSCDRWRALAHSNACDCMAWGWGR